MKRINENMEEVVQEASVELSFTFNGARGRDLTFKTILLQIIFLPLFYMYLIRNSMCFPFVLTINAFTFTLLDL